MNRSVPIADLIAAGLTPFAPEPAALKAGRLMPQEIEQCARRAECFAFQTPLSDLCYDWALYDNSGAEPILREWGENQ